jgi:hypothetical protein
MQFETLPLMPSGFFGDIESKSSARLFPGREQCLDGQLQIDELPTINDDANDKRQQRKLKASFAKHKRMSLWVSATQSSEPVVGAQKPLFRAQNLGGLEESVRPRLSSMDEFPSLDCLVDKKALEPVSAAARCAMASENVLPLVFAFLMEGELLSKVSLVCSTWADAATTAHASMMLASVGYSESMEEIDDDDESAELSLGMRPIAQSMERSWDFLVARFPWGCFLAEGGFKRVYKVHNTAVGAEEAVSVM